MEEENKYKSEHGLKNKKNLSSLLEMYYQKGYITQNKIKYSEGYSINPTQFKSDHLIEFDDGEQWAIHSTSTIRTDRAKQLQWDAMHIKNLNNKVTKVLLVFPDSLPPKEQQTSLSYQKQIREHKIYSAIDDCISTSELDQLIEEKALYSLEIGKRKAFEGTNFEEKIVNILSHKGNIEKWNTASRTQDGFQYLFFKKVIELNGIKKGKKLKTSM
nr:MspI family type II restriction endonuclease [Bacillus sp. T3]